MKPTVYKIRVRGHRGSYHLTELIPLYGSDFCNALGKLWPSIAEPESESSCIKWFTYLRKALVRLARLGEATPQGGEGEVYRHLRDQHTQPLDRDLYRKAMSNVAASIVADGKGQVNSRSRAHRVECLNGALKRLARYGFFPAIDPIQVKVRYQRRSLLSLAELSRSKGIRSQVDTSELALNAHADAMLELNIQRLEAVRSALQQDLLTEYEAFKEGQEWLDRTDLPSADEFVKKLATLKKREGKNEVIFEWLKGRLLEILGLEREEDLFAATVCLCQARFPHGWRARDLPWPYGVLISGFGQHEIVRRLESTSISITAAFGLLLIETAFNVASLEDLPRDPFVGKARHGKRMIATLAARKMRAKGEIVEASVDYTGLIDGEEWYVPTRSRPGELSGGDVIKIYTDMSRRLRDCAQPDVAGKFWLVRSGTSATGAVSNYLATMGITWWPSFLKRHEADPVFGGLPITRQLLRVTRLQIIAARGGFGHELAQVIANHAHDATTMGYLGSGWFRNQFARQMREFQRLLEAVFVQDVPSIETDLGLTKGELQERLSRAADAGLDLQLSCASGSEKAPHREVAKSGACRPLIPCEACPARSFVPCDRNFRNLHLAHIALSQAEPNWIVSNPDRWRTHWLPWRAVTEAYVQKIGKSPYKVSYARIASAVDAELRRGEIVLPIIV